MQQPLFLTAGQIANGDYNQFLKDQLPSSSLIYSSPATLAYNSPGAQGYGVKRAGLTMPESIMLLVSPGCCGRNSTILGRRGGYSNRMFYLNMNETDLITGRHLKKISDAVLEILEGLSPRPKIVLICLTCVDALLGTDLERVCRKVEKETGVIVIPTYMYALSREGIKPPMIAVRQALYSRIRRKPVNSHAVNLLGYFAPLDDHCEIYPMFHKAGLTMIRELSRCNTYNEYLDMGEANFNLILNPEASPAGEDLLKREQMPYIEISRFFKLKRIQKQYKLLGEALGIKLDDAKYLKETQSLIKNFKAGHPSLTFSVGQSLNANPFELSASLLSYGYSVCDIFASYGSADLPFIFEIAQQSPDTRIYSGISPKMYYYNAEGKVDITIGKDGAYYHPDAVNVPFCSDIQPFGYCGVNSLFSEIDTILEENA